MMCTWFHVRRMRGDHSKFTCFISDHYCMNNELFCLHKLNWLWGKNNQVVCSADLILHCFKSFLWVHRSRITFISSKCAMKIILKNVFFGYVPRLAVKTLINSPKTLTFIPLYRLVKKSPYAHVKVDRFVIYWQPDKIRHVTVFQMYLLQLFLLFLCSFAVHINRGRLRKIVWYCCGMNGLNLLRNKTFSTWRKTSSHNYMHVLYNENVWYLVYT